METSQTVSYMQLNQPPKINSFDSLTDSSTTSAAAASAPAAAAKGSFPNLTSRCTLASKPLVRRPTPGASLVAKEA